MTLSFATGRFAAAAIRARPRAEAVLSSQLLFGEPVTLLQTGRQYSRIRCCDDAFEGFVRTDQLLPVSEEEFEGLRTSPAFNLDLFSSILSDRGIQPITFGARLPAFDGLRLQHGGRTFQYSGQAAHSSDLKAESDLLIRLARRWLYVPALSGGRTPTGVDPAAFVQLAFRMINVLLPRAVGAMCDHGRLVDFMVQAQSGDLAFFKNEKGAIDHVGILLPNSTILHVDDRVRIDAVDHFGIFNFESQRYTHRLRVVKRLLPDGKKMGILKSRRERQNSATEGQILIF